MAKLHKSVVLDAATARLDLAVQALTGASRAVVRGMFEHGCVTLNGALCAEPGQRGARGDVVLVDYDPEQKYRGTPPPPRLKFRVAFEDAHVIVVEKPAGVLSVPAERGRERTLLDEIEHYLSLGSKTPRRAFAVHRLDRDTSGVLVFGKTRQAADALAEQFKGHKPERHYDVLVAGTLRDPRGTFESFIATAKNLRQYSTRFEDQGKHAVTHSTVEASFDGATLVRVHLETGRRNQIRVHFSEAGHPVLGDTTYAPERATHPLWSAHRLALHARTLGFTHPVSGRPVRVTSELPEPFRAFLATAR